MEIKKVAPNELESQSFNEVLREVYPENIRRLKQHEKPVREHLSACYFAEANGKIIGRACLFRNADLLEGKKAATIGHYEFTNNEVEAYAFLSFLEKEAKQAGCDFLIGPMNGSTWENYRFSLRNDSPNFLLEPFNHEYYNEQFRQAGFETVASYYSNKENSLVRDFEAVLEHETEFLAKGLRIRPIDTENYESELDKLYSFTARAFSDNYLYTPISEAYFKKKYREALPVIRPEFVLIGEEAGGTVVGFVFAYPDLLNKEEKSIVVKTLARDPDPKWKGLGEILGNRVLRAAAAEGFSSQVHAFMKDTNRSVKTSERFHGHRFKTYALYGKEI